MFDKMVFDPSLLLNLYNHLQFILLSISGNKTIANLLLGMGADINQQRAIFEFSSLHTAVQFNEIEMSQFLIDFGVDPECLTFDKETPWLFINVSVFDWKWCEQGRSRCIEPYSIT